MSKKFNYANQFNKNENQAPDEVTGVNKEPEVTNSEVKPEPEVRYGVVSGCERLNVRTAPSKEANPDYVITKGTKVTIVDEVGNREPNEICDWYKITTANGNINGYCMAEFIEIR